MPARKDDRSPHDALAVTRIERPGPPEPAPYVVDDDSAADTEVFVGRRPRESAEQVPSTATARETPSSRPPSSAPTVTLAPAPLDDQGFAARYLAQGTLGEGGMGTIGLFRDARIGRDVAMKTLRKAGSAEARMRFEREARVQGQLEHPAIVPVYDLGVRPDGTPFFTMKRLHGETLSNIMAALQAGDEGAQVLYPRRRLLTAYAQVCLAVAFAHARGVLHRDLKPGNIMLGAYGEVYVLDWGLAKLTAVEGERDSIVPESRHHETQVGEVMGTPGYMSPEQLRGEVDQLDARTDVYTLGVVLFELLTLEPLHDRSGLDTIYYSTLGKSDQRLSERAHKKGVPPELVAVCIRATGLRPEDRYAGVEELHDAVERFLEGHRDIRAREEMAARHAKTAVEAALLAPTVPEMRELAIRELGAALTLDPTHAGAIETLSRLMLETPAEMSAEARREFAEARAGTQHASRRGVLASYMVWIAYLPLVLALGIRDVASAAVTGGSVALAAVFSFLYANGRLGSGTRLAIYCFGTLAIASSCMLMGWAIVVPGLAAVHTVGFVLYGSKKLQPVALALGALAVIVPFALQESGWLPPAYAFEDGRMIVLPHMTGLPPVRTQIYLLLTSIGAIIAPTVVIARLRDTLEAAEERAFMHAWTLQHLVPGRAREAAAAMRKGAGG
jgi:serine/threonine-protein kinase